MYPIVEVLGREMGTYAIIAVIAMLLCGFLFCRYVKKAGRDDNDAIIFLLAVGVGILVGGHVLYGITNIGNWNKLLDASDIKGFFSIFGALFGGSVFYGGLIGGILAGLICIKAMRLDLRLYADLGGFVIPLFHGFARIGCFLGGCCYGIESEFGFVAHGNTVVPAVNDVRRFPVQLLESACNFVIFAIVFYLYKKNKLKGRLLFVYFGLYSVLRFFDEFLRGDAIRGFVLGISTSQFISIIMEAVALVGFICVSVKLKAKKAEPEIS